MRNINKQIRDIVSGNCWVKRDGKVDFMVRQKWHQILLSRFLGLGNWMDYDSYTMSLDEIILAFRVKRKYGDWVGERLVDKDSFISDLHLFINRGVREGCER